jgi:acyl carrier protein
MSATPERAEIFAAVASLLADSLAIDAAEVTLPSRLIDDLGMDSLDFVEILFALEKRFRVKMRSDELDVLLRAEFDPKDLVDEKFLPRADVERFSAWLPALASAPDPDRLEPQQLYGYITVESLVLLLEKRL